MDKNRIRIVPYYYKTYKYMRKGLSFSIRND